VVVALGSLADVEREAPEMATRGGEIDAVPMILQRLEERVEDLEPPLELLLRF